MKPDAHRLLLFGDDHGLPMLLKHVDPVEVVGLVASAIRPHQHHAIQQLSARLGVPLLIQQPLRAGAGSEFVQRIRELAPDWIFVNSYSLIIPSEVYGIATEGAVNVHGALLPEYRGANPIQWALLAGERETGVTIHHLTAALDAGDIVAQARVPIEFEDTWIDVFTRIGAATDALLRTTIPRLLSGNFKSTPQVEARARHFRRRTRDDGRIDWSLPVVDVYNRIRALVHPHPGAFFMDAGREFVIDGYRSIPAVAGLKHAFGGEYLQLRGEQVELVPLPGPDAVGSSAEATSARKRANSQVTFRVGDTLGGRHLGLCGVRSIDWKRREGEVFVDIQEPTQSPLSAEVRRIVETFCEQELQVKTQPNASGQTLGSS